MIRRKGNLSLDSPMHEDVYTFQLPDYLTDVNAADISRELGKAITGGRVLSNPEVIQNPSKENNFTGRYFVKGNVEVDLNLSNLKIHSKNKLRTYFTVSRLQKYLNRRLGGVELIKK